MKTMLFCAAALALGQTLATDYERASRLRIDATASFAMETTSMSMERDGEPVESRGGGGASTKETRHLVLLDEYQEKKDGAPVHVRRTFETIDSEGTIEFGERSMDIEHETPLEGVALDITVAEDGEISVEVADGSVSDDELLEGHLPGLALDALLPAEEVEQGDSWELESDAIVRALGFDVEPVLFRRPEAPEEEPSEGRRGGRGGFGRGGGGSPAQYFRSGEWQGKATLDSLTEEHEGMTCAAILLELECEGELPETDSGGREREFAAAPALQPAVENSFEIKVEGRILYSLADQRPILLELEGKVSTDSRRERSSERGSFVISSTQEGTFTLSVQVSEAKSE